jgi:cyclopropane-fatty-acyl-phospholipid synthase
MAIIRDVLGDYHPRDFAVRLWDGTTWGAEPGQPARFTLVLNHPGALRKMLLPPMELALGEAYIYGDFDVEGDMEGVYLLGDHYRRRPRDLAERFKHAGWLLSLPRRGRGASGRRAARQRGALHSRERDQQAVSYHYDTSNEFFSLWLDERMVYTCAYFETPQDDLATAQLAKLDYVCRKLRLQPGERLLDIGCGWGGLVIHAAREYGVEAVGVTLSQAQADLARERIRRAGLAGRCRVEVCDYRDVREPGGYDKLVSVGMFEQVGETRLGEYFEHAWDLLRPGGVFLNHGISCSHAYSLQGPSKFILRYVFPDGGLVPISTTLRIAEEAGFEVRDVESLREHYILTLRHWVRRLESCREEAVRLTDEVTYRVWRLYMSASANGFRVGRFNLHQALLLKPEGAESGLPLRRADWYARGP